MPTTTARAALYDATEAVRARLEERHAPRIARALTALTAPVLAAFEEGAAPGVAGAAVPDVPDALLSAVAGAMEDTYMAFARTTHALLRADEDTPTDEAARPATRTAPAPNDGSAMKATPRAVWQAAAEAFLRRYALAAVRLITATTRERITDALTRALATGASIPDAARAVREAWPEACRVRAVTIARTEIVSASNYGSAAGAASTGLLLRKEWIATRDARTRDTHRALDGVTVDADAAFSVGGARAMLPGDPALPARERIRCRCTVAWVPVEDGDGAPIARRSAPAGASWREERDERMRHDYPALRAAHGQGVALDVLAERESCSVSTVKRALWG